MEIIKDDLHTLSALKGPVFQIQNISAKGKHYFQFN